MMIEEAMPMATGSKLRAVARLAMRWLMVAQDTRQAAASRASQNAGDFMATLAFTPVSLLAPPAAAPPVSSAPQGSRPLSEGNLRTKIRVMGTTMINRTMPMTRRTDRQP